MNKDDSLVSAQAESNRIAVLRGGGLTGTKTVSVGSLGTDWATSAAVDKAIATSITGTADDRAERVLWRIWLPQLLAAAAAATVVLAVRAGRGSSTNEERQQNNEQPAPSGEIGVP